MKTVDKKRTMTAQRTGPTPEEGLWPIINIEKVQIEDYALVPPLPGAEDSADKGPTLTRFLRLHIDIPLDDADWTAVRERLVAGKREEAYQWLVKAGRLQKGTPRAHLFVKTALQKG